MTNASGCASAADFDGPLSPPSSFVSEAYLPQLLVASGLWLQPGLHLSVHWLAQPPVQVAEMLAAVEQGPYPAGFRYS